MIKYYLQEVPWIREDEGTIRRFGVGQGLIPEEHFWVLAQILIKPDGKTTLGWYWHQRSVRRPVDPTMEDLLNGGRTTCSIREMSRNEAAMFLFEINGP